jgi:hypothetical protein
MKKVLEFLLIFTLVFISIVILNELEILFHSKLACYIYREFMKVSSHWQFIISLLMYLFDFLFAFAGFLIFRYLKLKRNWPDCILLFIAIPALFPIFVQGTGIIAHFLLKPCGVPHYYSHEQFVLWFPRILTWLYTIFFAVYVLINLSRKYALIWILEFLVFLAYLAAFYTKLIGPVRLPFHLLCW